MISWEQSLFSLYDRATKELVKEAVVFSNYEEYRLENRRKESFARMSHLELNKRWEKDLFRLSMPNRGGTAYCCSHALKEAIESSELTGFKFDELKA